MHACLIQILQQKHDSVYIMQIAILCIECFSLRVSFHGCLQHSPTLLLQHAEECVLAGSQL